MAAEWWDLATRNSHVLLCAQATVLNEALWGGGVNHIKSRKQFLKLV